jgi:3-oxoacyl-[acyl-carrier-protein] synthase III
MKPTRFPVRLAGLGFYLPQQRLSSAELEQSMDLPIGWIERATGVRERRRVTHETTAGMGADAARMALQSAGMNVADLDAIVGASTAPHQAIPCTAALVQGLLEAPEGRSACFDLNATCLSWMFALHTAAHLIASGAYRSMLLFSSEVTSRSLNPAERESAVLFGDAAAASVLTCSEARDTSAIWHAKFATWNSGAPLSELVGAGTLHHPNDPATTPEMNMFTMRGPALFRMGARLIGPFLDQFFEELGWQRGEVDAVIPHQASRHAVELLTSRLGFRPDQVVSNLQTRGNCIAASIPLCLAEAAHAGRIQRGDRVVLVGSGAGLTLGALALTY